MTEAPDPRPEQEGFGEANLAEGQSENPDPDPEMVEDAPAAGEGAAEGAPAQPDEGTAEGGVERTGGDADAGETAADDPVDEDERRDQAEGE